METIEEEIFTNGTRKINIGLRCYAELKLQLTKEAENLGITLSEHCENVLLNRDNLQGEKENALKRIIILEKKITEQRNSFDKQNEQDKAAIEKLNRENGDLQKSISMMNNQLAIFSDKCLLELFAKLKGQNDIIETPEGQKHPITYNNPKDLLTAMIYSFKLKKP